MEKVPGHGERPALPLAWALEARSYGAEPRTDVHERHQVVLPQQGVLHMNIEGKPGLVGAGYFAVVGREMVHTYASGAANRFLILDLHPRMVEEVAEGMGVAQRAAGVLDPLRFLPVDRQMAALISLLEGELQTEGPGYLLLRESLARYVTGALIRRRLPAADRVAADIPFGRGIGRRAVAYMREHYAANLQMADIAGAAGMSISHFHRFFKRYTGVTPLQYLNALRIERAKDMLSRTDLPIAEVALEVGYQSQSSFTRLFTGAVGVPPLAYRRSHSG